MERPAEKGSSGIVAGIDLGTTRSAIAYVGSTGHVTCIPNCGGDVLTPSCVHVTEDGGVLVGNDAQCELVRHPKRTVRGFKRAMGRRKWTFTARGRRFTPQALSAEILKALVSDAERVVGRIDAAVISVPAYFGDIERNATLEAASLVGIRVLNLVNEPTAAALASAFDAYITAGGDGTDIDRAAIAATAPGINVICDLGGGTFDVTIIRIDGDRFDILATGGRRLGGCDFDEVIVEAMSRHLFDQNGPDPHNDPAARARMLLTAEQAKHILTVKGAADVVPPYDTVPPLHLTRSRFEAMAVPLLDQIRGILEKVMREAKLDWHQVEDLLLVGGASRMPMFRKMASEVSGKRPDTHLQPDLIVAQGAAIYAAILNIQGEASLAKDGTRLRQAAGALANMRGTGGGKAGALPYEPAFAQAAAAVRVRDVTSCSLGVVVRSPRRDRNVNAILIPRNSPLPTEASRIFVTRHDNQRLVCVPVVEGDRRVPAECKEIGRCVIDALPSDLPKGTPVEITFRHDTSGCIHVRAEELHTHTATETVLDRNVSPTPSPIDDLANAVTQLSLR